MDESCLRNTWDKSSSIVFRTHRTHSIFVKHHRYMGPYPLEMAEAERAHCSAFLPPPPPLKGYVMLSSLQTSALLMVGLLFTALSAAENSVCASCGTKPVNADIAVATFKPNLGPKVGGAKAVEVEVGFCSQGCHDAFAADPSAHAESATKACCAVAQTSCIVCDKKPVDAKIPVISFQPNPTAKGG